MMTLKYVFKSLKQRKYILMQSKNTKELVLQYVPILKCVWSKPFMTKYIKGDNPSWTAYIVLAIFLIFVASSERG